MDNLEELQLADAQLFVATCHALVLHPREITAILSPVISTSHSSQLSFSTNNNWLRVLLCTVSPLAILLEIIAEIAADLTEPTQADLEPDELLEDIQTLISRLVGDYKIELSESHDYTLSSARELEVHLATQSKKFGFLPKTKQDALLSFVQAKCLQLGNYYSGTSHISGLFGPLEGQAEFEKWKHGLVLPFEYFTNNYAIPKDVSAPAAEFFTLDAYWDQFQYLISPLADVDSTVLSKTVPHLYLSQVIYPLAAYHGYDLSPLSSWMHELFPKCDTLGEFELWDTAFTSLFSFRDHTGAPFPRDAYGSLLRRFFYACFYFGLYKEEIIKQDAASQISNQIMATLTILSDTLLPTQGGEGFAKYESISEFAEFESSVDFTASAENPLGDLFHESDEYILLFLLWIFTTCCTLRPLNGLTVRMYFRLKRQLQLDPDSYTKELLIILSNTSDADYQSMLSAVTKFLERFPPIDAETLKGVHKLILERLLQSDNFSEAQNYILSLLSSSILPKNVTYKLASRRFWELFNNASNLDDRIGKLKQASQCLAFMDSVGEDIENPQSGRAELVKIKHLMKAIHNLKNFKLSFERNLPITPRQIVERLSRNLAVEPYPPIVLISIVLEQNPKSYLAHEKLHRIINDLAIFMDIDVQDVSFARVQAACVESALIDGNFDFAYKQSKMLLSHHIDIGQTSQLANIWLMFYQVGKYILPDWFNDFDAKIHKQKYEVLSRQREILSLALRHTRSAEYGTDNSRLLLGQFRHVNSELAKWYEEDETHRSENVQSGIKSTQEQLQENFSGIVNEVAHSQKQASEKISNLFVSGLGWAIGARNGVL